MTELTVDPSHVYALVVGIEQYQAGPAYDLNGPAKDALGFAQWLLTHEVQPANIQLFLSPLDQNREILAEVEAQGLTPQAATRDRISRTITERFVDQGRQERRLYVFWAGHGFITKLDATIRRLLFTDTDTRNKWNLDFDTLLQAFQTAQHGKVFPQQIFFIDACANPIFRDFYPTLQAEAAGERFVTSGTQGRAKQFALFAAAEYAVATNLTQAGMGRFSRAVLEELQGQPLWPNMLELTSKIKANFRDQQHLEPVFWSVSLGGGDRDVTDNISQRITARPAPVIAMSTSERFQLINTLNDLPVVQFEVLVNTLNPPGGIVPPSSAPQGLRSPALLEWIEGPMGPGLNELQAVLGQVMVGKTMAQRANELMEVIQKADFSTVKKKVLTNRLTSLASQYEALNEQYDGSIESQQKIILKSRIEKLEQEIISVETEIKPQQPQSRNDLKQKSIAIGLLSLTTSLVVVTLNLLGFLQKTELLFYDFLMRNRSEELPDSEILIVEVTKEDIEYQDNQNMGRKDSNSLSDVAFERLLNRIESIKPHIIGLDIYHEALFPQLLSDRLNNDDRVFLICKVKVPMGEDEGRKPANNILPELYGFSDVLKDNDEVVRRHLWAMETTARKGECNSEISFSLAIAQNYLFSSGEANHFLLDSNKDEFFVNPSIGEQLTPNSAMYRRLDSMGNQTLLNYRGSYSPKEVTRLVYSLREILENGFPSELEQGKIVLVGTNISASESQYGQFSDLFKTPYGETIPGVYLQAQFISQLIHAARGERSLIWWLPIHQQIIIIIVYSISGSLVFVCLQDRNLILGTFFISVSSTIIISCACFTFFGGWISWIAPILALLLPSCLGLYLLNNRTPYLGSFRHWLKE